MSIADKLQSIETHIEEAYTEISRLGVDLTNVDKNIDNIADKLQEAYENTPKVTGEGSSLSLTPTRKGGLSIIPKGACEQDGTPTPDNPIDIKVVTGDNSFLVSNANLYNKTTMAFVRGAIQEDETVSPTNVYVATSGKISLKKGTYTFYNSVVTNWLFYIQCFQNGTRVYQTPVGSNAREHTFTLEDDYDVHLQLNTPFGSGVSVDDYLTDLTNNAFLLVGEIATEPSYIEHQEQTYTLHLGTNYLAGISTYKDEIIGKTDDWKIVRKTTKSILNGSNDENWGKSGTYAGNYYINDFYNEVLPIKSGMSNLTQNFVTTATQINNYSNCIFIELKTSTTSLNFKNADITSVQNLRTFLQNKNLIIISAKTTPTEETITDTTLITDLNNIYKAMGYDGTTNITITSNPSNAQMIASVSALKGE